MSEGPKFIAVLGVISLSQGLRSLSLHAFLTLKAILLYWATKNLQQVEVLGYGGQRCSTSFSFWQDLQGDAKVAEKENHQPTNNIAVEGQAENINESLESQGAGNDENVAQGNNETEETEADLPGYVEEDDKELEDKFKNHVKDKMKERDDLFDEMVVHEEQIRLGDAGWKARYYEVSKALHALFWRSVQRSKSNTRDVSIADLHSCRDFAALAFAEC